jgi:hypothetical protein
MAAAAAASVQAVTVQATVMAMASIAAAVISSCHPIAVVGSRSLCEVSIVLWDFLLSILW